MTYPFLNLTPRYAKAAFKLPPSDSLLAIPPSVAAEAAGRGPYLMPGYIPLDENDPEGHLEAAKKERQKLLEAAKKEREAAVQTYEVPGKDYVVTNDNEVWSCTCPGYKFRRKCRHVEEIKESL